ncbi:hypothetical protein B296_00011286 [Ensete ventricosum]|uniref:Uncharacterized protein n=1 Tax=Ensete ventricosum TaxID=4639 RepID=A0A427AVU7_ENSVE|nr:hypothetical protein B296_00011286 [Ensete ventricosum]
MPGVGPSEVIVKREIHKQLPRLQRRSAAAADVLRRTMTRMRRVVVALGIANPVNRGWVRRRRFLLLWPERSGGKDLLLWWEKALDVPTGDRPH